MMGGYGGMGGYGSMGGYGGMGGYSGMGGYGGMSMGGMGGTMGGLGMSMPNGGFGGQSVLSSSPAVDANGNPVAAITAGPTNNNNSINTNAPTNGAQLEVQRKAQLAEQKRQRRMFLAEATMQVVSGVMQLVLQLFMGLREIAGIAIGCYYSYHMFKSIRGSVNGVPGNQLPGMIDGGGGAYFDAMGNPTMANPLVRAAGSQTAGGSSVARALKTTLGAVVMYFIARGAMVAYTSARTSFAEEQRRARARAIRNERKRAARREERRRLRGAESADVSDSSDTDSLCSSCVTSDEESHYDDIFAGLGPSEPRIRSRRGGSEAGSVTDTATIIRERKIYVALHDYESNGQSGMVSFRAGDQFEIDDFNGKAWCSAVRLGDIQRENRVLVPGTFLRPLNLQQKF